MQPAREFRGEHGHRARVRPSDGLHPSRLDLLYNPAAVGGRHDMIFPRMNGQRRASHFSQQAFGCGKDVDLSEASDPHFLKGELSYSSLAVSTFRLSARADRAATTETLSSARAGVGSLTNYQMRRTQQVFRRPWQNHARLSVSSVSHIWPRPDSRAPTQD
jgi:hypothetical protein